MATTQLARCYWPGVDWPRYGGRVGTGGSVMSDKEQPIAIGRIVHYRWANPETLSQQSECQPALIARVFANGAVNLSIFDSTGSGVHGATAMRDAKSDPKNGPTWHWPMECSVRWTPMDFEPILGVREP